MPEETKVKREYRKVKTMVKEVVEANEGLTVKEISEKIGVMKWQCQGKLDKMVEKGEVVCTEGKYSKKQ